MSDHTLSYTSGEAEQEIIGLITEFNKLIAGSEQELSDQLPAGFEYLESFISCDQIWSGLSGRDVAQVLADVQSKYRSSGYRWEPGNEKVACHFHKHTCHAIVRIPTKTRSHGGTWVAGPELQQSFIFIRKEEPNAMNGENWHFWHGHTAMPASAVQGVGSAVLPENKLQQTQEDLRRAREEVEATRQQLLNQEKMASLGQMTAGIAHEIKNPLNFVNNFSKLSRELLHDITEELEEDSGQSLEQKLSEVKEDLEELKANLTRIDEHSSRADSIVSSMLLHSRGESGERMDVDVNQLVDEFTDLAYHGMRARNKGFNAKITKDYDSPAEQIKLVPQDFSRVIMNIITNGFQALRDYYHDDGSAEPEIRVSTEYTDAGATIRIADNGPGIEDEMLKKIFEPFYTTKPAGEGTGLGLSMSKDIIEDHGGSLNIETGKKQGTEFVIFLPY